MKIVSKPTWQEAEALLNAVGVRATHSRIWTIRALFDADDTRVKTIQVLYTSALKCRARTCEQTIQNTLDLLVEHGYARVEKRGTIRVYEPVEVS